MRLAVWLSVLVLLVGATTRAAQQSTDPGSPRQTIWQGVFTDEQVQRGSATFNTNCVRCHALDAQGVPFRMSGEAFWNNWADDPLEVLYSRIKANMPNNAPNSLAPQTYADVVSFILSANGVPAGGTVELTPARVGAIQMVRRDGPRPVPAGALVNVVGCLVQNGSNWVVESASDVMRSRSRDLATDMAQVERLSVGDKRYDLKFPLIPLTSMRGQIVVARGLLLRGPDGLNVESVRSLGRPCS